MATLKAITIETLLTAKISLTAEKLRLEHLVRGAKDPQQVSMYNEAIHRCEEALLEINDALK